jgi:tRNA modification GTPase
MQNCRLIDDALCLIMRAPRSFTGEDTVEFHGHGGVVSTRQILRAALENGARMAEPGEFSRRAFLNGKMDLLQAEAVIDIIRARSDRASLAAAEQMDGALSKKFNSLYDDVLNIASDVGASLDFPEDELPQTVMPDIATRLRLAIRRLESLLASWNEGHLLRDGATVVITGRPNAGKSTLMNFLLGKDRAIVSHIPGTTRDVIEDSIVIKGIPARLIDTAGLCDTNCEVEKEGIRRARAQLKRGDLVLYVIDASVGLHADDLRNISALDSSRVIIVINKIDQGVVGSTPTFIGAISIMISLCRGDGLDVLRNSIATKLTEGITTSECNVAISERHRCLLVTAENDLQAALSLVESTKKELVVPAADHIHYALEHLGYATGRVYEEELLDRIFSRFCIGK